jgi:hypothetical protein
MPAMEQKLACGFNIPEQHGGILMTYEPNREPDLRTTPPVTRRGSMWGTWIAVAAVILVAAFAWMEWGGSTGTDPATTASTKPPITQPAPEPMTPATPPAAAPAAPSDSGTKL